jgi:hypothetical protein
MLRFDFVSLSGAHVTPEGWIRDRPVVARTGIQEYRRADGTIRREYRPPEEVFHADALASLHAVPVTNGHPGVVTAESPAAIIGSSLSPGIQQDGNVLADVVIHNPKAMGPNRELSLGYRVELDETPGEIDGQSYDAVQRNIRVNHIAVVHRGRAGNARLRLDHDDAASEPVEKDASMTDKLVSVRLDGLEYQAAPEVKRALERHDEAIQAARDATAAATARADAAEAQRDTLQAKLDAAEAEKAQIRKDALEQAKARLDLEGKARELGLEVKADASDRAIREAVIGKVRADGRDLSSRSDAYIDAAFELALDEHTARQAATAGQRIAMNGGNPNPAPRADDADPFAGKVARLSTAWKEAV